jgi:DNA-damage-inducible protein J
MTTTIQARIKDTQKQEFAEICEDMGINITTAISMFVTNVINTKELPFTPTAENIRNKDTVRLQRSIERANRGEFITVFTADEFAKEYFK